MRGLNLPHAVLLAACAGSTAAAAGSGHRVLHAATRRSDVSKRDMKIAQKFEAEVVYVGEENGWNGRETFASSVKVGSRKPILCLEEIEHLLEDVQCRNGGMMLHFVDESAARDARAAAHGGHGGMGGLIITSHHSCNRDGERAVYKVDDVSFAKKGVALDLAVTEALWQDAFDNIDINFGHTRYDHIYRRHSDFMRARKKRQDDGLAIPMDTPDNIIDVTLDLTSELLNTTFTAEDFVTGLENFINLPVVPTLPLEIGCKNCSTRGEIVITQGAIKIDTKQIDFVPDIFDGGDDGKDVNSIITGGEFDLAVSGFGAHLEMFARPVKSGSYEIALFPLPVLGFVIPGIGQAGASFEPKISVDFEIDGELAINYGIDVAIPDGAGIKIALGDLANTTITGIKGATLKALPFTSDVTDAEIAVSVAFTPTIPIGFEFSDKLSTLVSVALELPRLDAKLTPNAKAQCALLDQGNKTKPAEISKPKDANLSGLVLVEANISVVVDVAADLTLPLLPAPFDSAGTTVNIFSTEMPLMTSCVRPVKGTVKFTQKSPAATITADKANYAPPPTSSCTTHVEEKPCDCGTATTTVYAAPPTDAPVTSANYGAPPPEQSSPPLELTPYYPEVPTPPADPETPVVETPIGGQGPTPHYPDSPTDPVLTPTGGAYGPGEQPPTSTPCTSSETIRITVPTPPASSTPPPVDPPIIIIPGSTPCSSSAPEPPTSLATTASETDGYDNPTPPVISSATAPYTEDGNSYPTPPVISESHTENGYGNPTPPVISSATESYTEGGYGNPTPPVISSATAPHTEGEYPNPTPPVSAPATEHTEGGYGNPTPPVISSATESHTDNGYGNPTPPVVSSMTQPHTEDGYGNPTPPVISSATAPYTEDGYSEPTPPVISSSATGPYTEGGYGNPTPPVISSATESHTDNGYGNPTPPVISSATEHTEGGYGNPTPPVSAPATEHTEGGYGNPTPPIISSATQSHTENGYGNPTPPVVSSPHTSSEIQSHPPSTLSTSSLPHSSLPLSSPTSPPTTTPPPYIQESSGFMAPPNSTAPSGPATNTMPPEFTGAAVAAYGAPEMGWGGVWRVGVVVGGLVMGAVVV